MAKLAYSISAPDGKVLKSGKPQKSEAEIIEMAMDLSNKKGIPFPDMKVIIRASDKPV